jgi:CheY-like chemotaxis protein
MMDRLLALVVEDEHNLSIVFGRALRGAGFETEVICSGDTALTWLSSEVPDVVLLDLHLPRVPGMEILRYIRAEPRLTDVRVAVITAYHNMAAEVEGEADMVLLKPLTYGQLCEAMEQLKDMVGTAS